MVIQTEYFDPDTGIIHIGQNEYMSVGGGTTDSVEMGLEDTDFNDVKVKLLSIEYRVEYLLFNRVIRPVKCSVLHILIMESLCSVLEISPRILIRILPGIVPGHKFMACSFSGLWQSDRSSCIYF